MADDNDYDSEFNKSLKRLDQLTPTARERVQDALKKEIEAELGSGAEAERIRGEFSRGIIFSRSRPASLLQKEREDEIVQKAATMDEATFARFARNLSQLKKKE